MRQPNCTYRCTSLAHVPLEYKVFNQEEWPHIIQGPTYLSIILDFFAHLGVVQLENVLHPRLKCNKDG